jgi:glycosyltransferase involved in cell wall biosynthesis
MEEAAPVSICLTTYNRASVLPATLDSLLAQSFGDFELIISDDCSTDDTERVCRSYQDRDSRVQYFRNGENLRMPGNLNAAIQRAKGGYIANVHDGDVYRRDLIEKWKSALDELPTATFVFNAYEAVSREGTRTVLRHQDGRRMDGREIALHYFKTFTSCVWGTVMARRSAYERAGLFNAKFGFISDVDMWLRLAYDADVAYVPEPLITITPREPDHPYAFVHWRHRFWTLGIYVDHLNRFRLKLPSETARYRASYPSRSRALFLRDMALCVKHGRWDRAREGLAIWRDAGDGFLRFLGKSLGSDRDLPDWYSKDFWRMAETGSA